MRLGMRPMLNIALKLYAKQMLDKCARIKPVNTPKK
jgi:hypothetical protein